MDRHDAGNVYSSKRRRVHDMVANKSALQSDVKVLVPNSHPEVDVFLLLIVGISLFEALDTTAHLTQDGVLEGVRQGTLDEAHFYICPDPVDPTKVIESYKFCFQYSNVDLQNTRQLAGMAFLEPGPQPVPVTNIKKSVYALLAIADSLARKMPDLPGKPLPLPVSMID